MRINRELTNKEIDEIIQGKDKSNYSEYQEYSICYADNLLIWLGTNLEMLYRNFDSGRYLFHSICVTNNNWWGCVYKDRFYGEKVTIIIEPNIATKFLLLNEDGKGDLTVKAPTPERMTLFEHFSEYLEENELLYNLLVLVNNSIEQCRKIDESSLYSSEKMIIKQQLFDQCLNAIKQFEAK